MARKTYAVVGGGASRIAAAYYLKQQGIDVELIERSEHLGGRMASCYLGERQVAMGSKNIGKNYHLFRDFTQAMGKNPYEFFGLKIKKSGLLSAGIELIYFLSFIGFFISLKAIVA